jgi:DNA-binding transcriptional ArsR family regulator
MGRRQRPQHPHAAVNPRPAVERTLAALADPYQRRAIELLGQRPHRAGELADALKLPASAMSRRLRALRQSGLVVETHPGYDARVRIYALKDGALADLKHWLAETERLWSEQLAAFKSHVEKK